MRYQIQKSLEPIKGTIYYRRRYGMPDRAARWANGPGYQHQPAITNRFDYGGRSHYISGTQTGRTSYG